MWKFISSNVTLKFIFSRNHFDVFLINNWKNYFRVTLRIHECLKFINTLNMVSSKIKSSLTLSTKSFTWAFVTTDSKTSLSPHHLTIHLWKSHCQWALALCVPRTNIFVLAVPCAQPLHLHSNNQRCIYTPCRCLISNHRNCLWAAKDVYILPKSLISATT